MFNKNTISALFTRSNLQFFILAAIVISFPWSSRINNTLCVVLAIWYFVDANIIAKLRIAFSHKLAWLFYIIAIWYAVWALLFGFHADAAQTMERKIPFVLFPLILASENYITQKRLQQLLYILLISCVIAGLVCEIVATKNYLQTGSLSFFAYQNLSMTTFWHPGHMSNYYCLLIIWITLIYIKLVPKIALPSKMQLACFIFIIIFMLQLTSKTIMLFLAFFIPWLCYKIFKHVHSQKQIIYVSLVTVLLCFSFYFFNYRLISNRFVTKSQFQSWDSNVQFNNTIGSRAMAIKEAYNKVKPVWYKGFGTGQANTELMQQFKEKNYTDLIKAGMQTHNQFMHTWLDIGFFGMLYLLFLFTYLGYTFIKNKNHLAAWFIMLIVINFLTDDMLEIQAGLVFFLLWICLFLFEPKSVEKSVHVLEV